MKRPAPRIHNALVLGGIWLAAFVFLLAFGLDTRIRLDVAAQLLDARTGRAIGRLATTGIGTSLPGYLHGALFIRYLTLLGSLGVGVRGLLLINHALNATAASVVYRLATRIDSSTKRAALSAAVALGLFALGVESSRLETSTVAFAVRRAGSSSLEW